MRLSAHRTSCFIRAIIAALFVPIAVVATFAFLFTLAFLDYAPPDRTWSEWMTAPPVVIGAIWLLTLIPPYVIFSSNGRRNAECARLDRIMLERMDAVRLQCADFYDDHGRAPAAEDKLDFGAPPTPETRDAFPFVLLGDARKEIKIDGFHPLVAPRKPWKSASGWRSVVLLESGEIKLIDRYETICKIYREVDRTSSGR